MLHALLDHPAIVRTLDEISQVLQFDVRTLDTSQSLQSTISVQLCLLAAGVATARALLESGLRPLAVAGMSVGSFAAAVIAESITLHDAVVLVRSRAEQMERLYPHGYGMAAVVGLREETLRPIVERLYTADAPVYIANINAPMQIALAGSITGIKLVLEQASIKSARKATLLDVVVPSHCPLMRPIAETLHKQLGTMSVNRPAITYISNLNARPIRDAAGVANDLAENIAHGVRWHDSTAVAQELGCELFLEMPPGHTLSDLARENLSGVFAYPVSNDLFSHVLKIANRSS
jgi:malonate decarboxylase epsilon subunit